MKEQESKLNPIESNANSWSHGGIGANLMWKLALSQFQWCNLDECWWMMRVDPLCEDSNVLHDEKPA